MNIIPLGLIWGLLLASQDLMNYFLYILLPLYSPEIITCENFLTYYTLCSIIYTILYGIYSLFSGIITDYLAPRINKAFLITVNIQILLMPIMTFPYLLSSFPNTWIFLCIIWQIQQLMSVQANNFFWMIVKQNIKSLNDINRIGNTGELLANTLESLMLIVIGLANHFYSLSLEVFFLYFLLIILTIHLTTFFLTYSKIGYAPNLVLSSDTFIKRENKFRFSKNLKSCIQILFR